MPNVSLEPAATEVSLDDLFSDIKRGLFVEGRGVSSIDQQRYNFQFGGAVIREITQRQARRDGEGRGVSVAHAGLLGVVRRPRRPGDLSAVGHVGRRQGRARPDQRGQSRLSAGALPQRHRPEHGGRRDADPRRSPRRSARRCWRTPRRRAPRTPRCRCRARSNRTRASPTTASRRADASEDLDITATVWVGAAARRRPPATTPSADALKRLADEAVQIARVSPVHREYVPTLGPLEYPEARGFADATADVDRRRARRRRSRPCSPRAAPRR